MDQDHRVHCCEQQKEHRDDYIEAITKKTDDVLHDVDLSVCDEGDICGADQGDRDDDHCRSDDISYDGL